MARFADSQWVSRYESTAGHFEHLTARDLQMLCDVVCCYEWFYDHGSSVVHRDSTIAFLSRKHEAKSEPEIGRDLAGYLCVTKERGSDKRRMSAKSKNPTKAAFERFSRMLLKPLNFRGVGVRQTFVVGVDFLREVLQNLSSTRERWWIEKESATNLIVGHDRPDDEERPQLSPTLISVAKVDADTVCLFTSQKIVKPGIYRYKGRTIRDEALDLEWSWERLKRELLKRDRRERFQRAQQRLIQRIGTRSLPNWRDCFLRDSERRALKTDAKMLQRLLASDEVHYAPDRLLVNEWKWIGDVSALVVHFRELLQAGCKAGTLAQTLGYFQSYRSARMERHQYRFPTRPKLRKLAKDLRESANEISDLQFWYDPPTAVLDEQMVAKMRRAHDEIRVDSTPPWRSETDVFDDLAGNTRSHFLAYNLDEPTECEYDGGLPRQTPGVVSNKYPTL